MKPILNKASLFMCLLCICMMLAVSVTAQDEDIQPVGAYPGAPTSAMGQPTQVAYAYPSAPTSVSTGPATGTFSAYPAAPSSAPSTGTITAIYSTQAPPVTQQKVLLSYDVQTSPPTAVYYSGTFMTWTTFYQRFPANSPALWVATSAGWSWYATCPLGGWIQNLMYVPYTGTMKLYEFYPDGRVKLYSYGFATPGYKYIWFYADTPGRHISMFTIFDRPSNYITIDVV